MATRDADAANAQQDGSSSSSSGDFRIANASNALRGILRQEIKLKAKGTRQCIAKLEEKDSNGKPKVKPGFIIAMVRSFRHHFIRYGVRDDQQFLNAVLNTNLGQFLAQIANPIFRRMGREELIRRGYQDRDFVFIHTAVYVGKIGDKHYVIENAGGLEDEEGRAIEGPFLQLVEVGQSFNDVEFDSSYFLLIKPPKCGDTAQRAMAAFCHDFKFMYYIYGFNCETFTSACAGQFSSDLSQEELSKNLEDSQETYKVELPKPIPFTRVMQEQQDPDRVSPEAKAAAQAHRAKYVKELQNLFMEKLSNIDSSRYELIVEGEKVGVRLNA